MGNADALTGSLADDENGERRTVDGAGLAWFAESLTRHAAMHLAWRTMDKWERRRGAAMMSGEDWRPGDSQRLVNALTDTLHEENMTAWLEDMLRRYFPAVAASKPTASAPGSGGAIPSGRQRP